MTKTAADIARMSGLEQVEYLAGSEEPFAPIAPFFNMETISYREGEVVLPPRQSRSTTTPSAQCTAGSLRPCWIRRAAPLYTRRCGRGRRTPHWKLK